ncbi:MAG: type II toxin-antitoxin system HicA family toxin [Azoarcus sp.]|jgi:predicted RNA binding protein YcfA (HicA-like mRNA interferase family)|nr:type II toxin-antitoxin system HicA family toxin [Azoarcus sp.]
MLRIGLARCQEVCMIHTMKSADIIRLLEGCGWKLANVRGSHHVFRHPDKAGHISVPHPKKDLGTGLVKKLLKQAGLEEDHEISDCH